MSSFLQRILLLWCALVSAHAVSLGQRPTGMNLERLVGEAGLIFGGKVIKVETGEKVTRMKLYATEYTFLVTDPLYGVKSDTITIMQYGGKAEGREFYPPGVPRFKEGEDVLVLMYAPSKVGMTSTVGKEQGKFSIQESDSGTGRLVINSLGNRGLFNRLKHPELLTDKSWLEKSTDGPLPYNQFVETLRELVQALKH